MLTRRRLLTALPLLKCTALLPQLPPAPTTRPNLAEIDHLRILAAANKALAHPPAPNPDPQSQAFLDFTLALPALAAATLIDSEHASAYTAAAAAQLQAWFLAPDTRLPTTPRYPAFQPIAELSALAEVAQSLPFLPLDPELLVPLKKWFADYLTWLAESRLAVLARDAKDHHGSSWLLQTAAYARLTANDAILADLRHHFKTVTVRAQIDAAGFFPHELPSPNAFRDSLFNLDLLAGACQLLSTRFESLWDHELQDGPGMRAAIARHAPYIANRAKWPYPADQTKFNLLPARRPALVFAGRAFTQPDYVTLWRTLPPDPTDPEILRSFPIRQPILWLTQPKPRPT